MKNHEGTTDFLKLFFSLLFVGIVVWWIESRFGANIVLVVFALIAGTLFFIGGSLLTSYIQKNTLSEITKFSANDASIDRHRMLTLKEMSKSDAFYAKADATLKVIEARKALPKEKEVLVDNTFWQDSKVDTEGWV